MMKINKFRHFWIQVDFRHELVLCHLFGKYMAQTLPGILLRRMLLEANNATCALMEYIFCQNYQDGGLLISFITNELGGRYS